MADEESTVVLEERVVLQKFDGDVADGRLVERITIVDGDVVAHETFTIEENACLG